MTQRVDLSQYYTRKQADERYTRAVPFPEAPTGLTIVDSGVLTSTTEQDVYLDVQVVDPTPPGAAGDVAPYLQSYVFDITYTTSGKTITKSLLMPWEADHVFRLIGLPFNQAVSVTASAVDYLGQRGPATEPPLTLITAQDEIAPSAPVIQATAITVGALITVVGTADQPSGGVNEEIDFSHYELWRGRGYSGGIWLEEATCVATLTSTIFNDLAIPASHDDYYYYAKSVDIWGNVSAGSPVVGPIALALTEVATPDPPAIATATVTRHTNGTLTFTFLTPNIPGLAHYRIWRRVTSGATWMLLDTVSAGTVSEGTPVSYLDTRCLNGVTYAYTVSAVTAVGDETAYLETPVKSETAWDTIGPEQVFDVEFDGRPGGVDVSWAPSTSPDVKFYQLRYKLTPADDYGPALLVVGTRYTIYGLTASRDALGNRLTVEIVAHDGLNVSNPHVEAVSWPALDGYRPADQSLPWMPTNQVATPNRDGSITIGWTAPEIPDLAGYQIDLQERRDGVLGDWTLLATVTDHAPGPKTFNDVGLEPYNFVPVEYRYRVRALDASGNISPVNLLEDPSFEDSSCWNRVFGIVAGRAGNAAPVTAVTYDPVWQEVPVTAGRLYVLSGYLKANAVVGAAGTLAIEWLNNAGAVIGSESRAWASTNVWLRRVLLTDAGMGVRAPDEAVRARVRFQGDPAAEQTVVLWDDGQFEENGEAAPYGTGRTAFVRAVDTDGPQDYSNASLAPLNLRAITGLGFIGLRWNNPSAVPNASFTGPDLGRDVDYINGVFEIWRARDANFTNTLSKLADVPAANDGAEVGYDDNSPYETIAETWYYRLKARDRFGNTGDWLNRTSLGAVREMVATSETFDTNLPVPGKPDQPTAVAHLVSTLEGDRKDGTVDVSWDSMYPTQVAGFRLWRRAGTGTPVLVQTLRGGVTSTNDAGLTEGLSYSYAITAYNVTGGESPLSDYSAPGVLSEDKIRPPAPTDIRLTGGPGSIRADWTRVSGAISYLVEHILDATVQGASYTDDGATSLTTYLVPNLTVPGLTHFRVRITAVDAVGNQSTPATSAELGDGSAYLPGDNAAPDPPTIVEDYPQPDAAGGILLQWNASISTDAAGYVVEKQAGIGRSTVGPWEQLAWLQGAVAQYRAVGLEPFTLRGTEYRFRVRTLDASGRASTYLTWPTWYKAVDTTGPQDYPPTIFDLPGGTVPAVGGLGCINLTWRNAPAAMFDYFQCTYEIWRATDAEFSPGGTGGTKIAEVPGTNDGALNTFVDLSPDDSLRITYFYKLRARDRFGNVGDWLNASVAVWATSKTLADMGDGQYPELPSITGITDNGNGTVTLGWNEASTGTRMDLVGYSVWRKLGSEDDELWRRVTSILATSGTGGRSWTEAPPYLGVTWDYIVTAIDNQNEESLIPDYDVAKRSILPIDTRPPAAPGYLNAVGGLGSMTFTYGATATPGISRYRLVIDAIQDVVDAQDLEVMGTTMTIVLPKGPSKALLTAGMTAAHVRVYAKRDGSGALSDPRPLSSLNLSNYLPIDTEPPYPPNYGGITPQSGPFQTTLTWRSSRSKDVTRYLVECTQLGQYDCTKEDVTQAQWYACGTGYNEEWPSSENQHYARALIAGLQPEGTYRFRVSSVDNANNSSSAAVPEGVKERPRGLSTADEAGMVLGGFLQPIGMWWSDEVPYAVNDVIPFYWVGNTYWVRCISAHTNQRPHAGTQWPDPDYATFVLNTAYWDWAGFCYSHWVVIPSATPTKPAAILTTPVVTDSGWDTESQSYTYDFSWTQCPWVDTAKGATFRGYWYQLRENMRQYAPQEVSPGAVADVTQTTVTLTRFKPDTDYTFEIFCEDSVGLRSNLSMPLDFHTASAPA